MSKPKLISMYKKNGMEMKVNEDSIGGALAIGWSKQKPKSNQKKQ